MQYGIELIVISLLILVFILFAINRLLRQSQTESSPNSKRAIFTVTIIFGLAIIFAFLPIESSAKSSVFTLLGLVITAIIAVSSTTFASNAMAGVMLRTIKNFKSGNFIQVGEHFGRVSETGFLHTEIQTKNRNLTTLPNMYLVTNAVTVMPENEALVDATLSLGYDVSHHDVEVILKKAATKIGLQEPFVQITELGDFSIGYRIAGFLTNTKLLLSARSNLRKQIIDSLHSSGIEIVSPTFMNQRQFSANETFISKTKAYQERNNAKTEKNKVFDKAETAELIEKLKAELKQAEIELKEQHKIAENENEITQLETKKARLVTKIEALTKETES